MNVYCFATIREIVAGAIWVGQGSGYVLSGWGKIVEIGGSNPDIQISDYSHRRALRKQRFGGRTPFLSVS